MHVHSLEKWKCNIEPELDNSSAEKRTWFVIILTLVMMVAEICAGTFFGSMALLADGWHMGTHAAALGIAAFAYWYARKQKDNPKFTFGTGKVNVLGGYTSSTILIIVAILMIYESVERLLSPIEIHFEEAIAVAALGLVVNLISALMLKDDHHHHHHHHHPDDDHHHHCDDDIEQDHDDHHHLSHECNDPDHHHQNHSDHHHDHGQHQEERAPKDHNLRAAYIHVIADALTSVTAIVALTAGKYLGWAWMDPIMGIVGALVIIRWGIGLAKDTGNILLDCDVNKTKYEAIRKVLESDSDNRIADMHLFKIGSQRIVGMISIVTHYPRSVEHYKSLLSGVADLAHVTIEVNACEGESCIPNSRPQYN
ncbi:MAG: cation diffusion facilitator family transporter [Desulfobacteraceae bacterium]|jgi:cation diffusion facilitator family transporter